MTTNDVYFCLIILFLLICLFPFILFYIETIYKDIYKELKEKQGGKEQ